MAGETPWIDFRIKGHGYSHLFAPCKRLDRVDLPLPHGLEVDFFERVESLEISECSCDR